MVREKQHHRVAKLILILTIFFVLTAGCGLYTGSRYIRSQLLLANENMAMDFALLVQNNFEITDEEVSYMKTLTFNEMEVDSINYRLMEVGNDVNLNAEIINVYLVASLTEDEIKYTIDDTNTDFFGYEPGTKLDGIWLLNGKIDEDGKFQEAQRDDICRYTQLTEEQKEGIKQKKAFGEMSSDTWGNFITGYAPVYTVEGNFVGLLGIDMDPDKCQSDAQGMIFVLFIAFGMISVAMLGLFLYFYFKYIKAREGQLYFDFYSRMSHDMRTPMNGILGMAALSKDEDDIAVLHHNFTLVEEAGQYMLGLINDTLDVQKLDAGRLKLDPKLRNCQEVVDSLISMIKPEADKKGIELRLVNKGTRLDIYSYIDELRIQQIFMNIMSNAIKFTPRGGSVTFSIECLGCDGKINHDRFQITDTGIGMQEKFIREHLFKPFEQEQNSVTTQYGGSGLGLSIVKNLVALMGGRIEVTSILGKGTTFTVYLDIVEVDKEQAMGELASERKPEEDPQERLKGKKILLCEDHMLNAEIASKLLMKKGCEVTAAENGEIGLTRYKDSPVGTFDLILMDIRMPVMDGMTAARKIRKCAKEDSQTIPILAMTANAYEDDIQNCLEAGMNDHIAKPINPMVMYQKIEDALQK